MASGMAGKMDEIVSGLGQKVLELSQDKWVKLALSILIDLIGILSYIIPLVRWRAAFSIPQMWGVAVGHVQAFPGIRGHKNVGRVHGRSNFLRFRAAFPGAVGGGHRRLLGAAFGTAGVSALRELTSERRGAC